MKKWRLVFICMAVVSIILQCLYYFVWDNDIKDPDELNYRMTMEELNGITVEEFWNKIFPLEEKTSKEKYDKLWEKYYYFNELTNDLTNKRSPNKLSSFVKFIKPRFFYDTGYNKLTAGFNNKYDITHGVIAICLLIIPLSIMYYYKEKGYKICRVKPVFLALLVEAIIYIPELVCILFQYGTQGIGEQAYSLIHLNNWSTGNTLWYYLLVLYLTRAIGLIFVGASFYLISQFLYKVPLVAGGIILVLNVIFMVINESKTVLKYLAIPCWPVLGNVNWSNFGSHYSRLIGLLLMAAYIFWIAFCFNFRVMHFTKEDYNEWQSHFDLSNIKYRGTLK